MSPRRWRYTSGKRRADGYTPSMHQYGKPTSHPAPAPVVIEMVPVGEGMVACPDCGGGVRLIPWDHIRQLLSPEDGGNRFQPWERVDRIGAHRPGGAKSNGSRSRCPGSYRIPPATTN